MVLELSILTASFVPESLEVSLNFLKFSMSIEVSNNPSTTKPNKKKQYQYLELIVLIITALDVEYGAVNEALLNDF